MAEELLDEGHAYGVDDADPTLVAAREWGVADSQKVERRKKKFQKLIAAGAILLHPDHLDFLPYIQNWDEVDRSLPTFSAKTGRYRDRVRPMRLGEYRVYCLDLVMPTVALVQQLMNYRTRQGRSMRDVPTSAHPVSRSQALLDREGLALVGVAHTYLTPSGLVDEMGKASQQVKESRQREHGWDPLNDSVLSDGVEDGGLWLQTVFAPAGEDGEEPDWTRAVGALAPADAASRKAVCDARVDPDGKLATLPLLKPRRSDVFDNTDKEPSAIISVSEAVAIHLGRVKSTVSGFDFVDDLPDEARELLHTTVMPVRLAYRVTDRRGRDVRLDGPALFRSIQKHFHGPEHLGHPPTEAERLVADDIYAALRRAAKEGLFDTAAASGSPATTEWTLPLLEAVCGQGSLEPLEEIGLPPTWQGMVAATVMLVFGDGPERAIIGKVLKSRPQGGKYSDRLDDRRLALLREWIFGELPVNRRAFEQVNAKAFFEDPLRAWDGETDALVECVHARKTTDTFSALFEVLATVAAAHHNMQIVDIGSRQTARGFASIKARQALLGRRVRTAPTADPQTEFVPCGPVYMRALLADELLLENPDPGTMDGIALEAPTDTSWNTWAAGKTGALREDGSPTEPRLVRAAMTDDLGRLMKHADGTVRYDLVPVPELAPIGLLDQFSNQALTRRAKERGASNDHQEPNRPLGKDERASEALDAAVKFIPALGREISKLEALEEEHHVFDLVQRSRLSELALEVRGAGQPDKGAIAGRIDALVRMAKDREAQIGHVQDVVDESNRAAATDLHGDGEDDEFLSEEEIA
ncbi:hypothetical protein ACWD0A_23730 [Streptomyces sp. NPDC002867]